MSRPRTAVVSACVGLGLLLTACQLPTASGAAKSAKKASDKVALVPFGSLTTDPVTDPNPGMVSIPADTALPDTTEPEEIVAAAEDTTPEAPATTDASENPICRRASKVVSLNTKVDKALAKAINTTKPKT